PEQLAKLPDLHRVMPVVVVNLAVVVENLDVTRRAGPLGEVLVEQVGGPLLATWYGIERQLDFTILGRDFPLNWSQLVRAENVFDGPREFFAVFLTQFHLASRQRVRISAAAHEEQGRRFRVLLLDIELGEAGVIAAPFV